MNLESHPNLGAGMNRDVQRHLLDGQFYDALDVIVDIDGKTRKRGGSTPLLPVSVGTYPQWLADYHSGNIDDVRVLYGIGNFYNSGANNLPFLAMQHDNTPRLGGAPPATGIFGRPFRHGRYVCFPGWYGMATYRPLVIFAGTRAHRFTPWELNNLTAASNSITAGSSTVTIAAADRPNIGIGDWFGVSSGTSVFWSPVAYVDETSGRIFTEHQCSFAVAAQTGIIDYVGPGTISGLVIGARAATSFQNRIIYGDLATQNTAASEYRLQPNAIAWSALQTEVVTGTGGLVYASGFNQHIVPFNNILLVPDITRIVGLAPVGPSQLLILSPERTLRLAGNFATISADNQQLPIDLQPISTRVGCISDRSIQESSYGVLWAASDGVWLYDGAELTNTMDGRLLSYWRSLVTQGAPAFQICGSALLRGDHYVLSTTLGNFLLNLRLGAWTRLRDDWRIAGSTIDPAEPHKVYACGWYDPNSAPTGIAATQLDRLDTILDPSATNAVDHDGTTVTCSLESQAYVQGDPARLKRVRRVSATADVKAPTNLLPPSSNGPPPPIGLPNQDTDSIPPSTKWWENVGAATLTPVTTVVLGGAYSMRVVTVAANEGILYFTPGGRGDGLGGMEMCEVWVRNDTAGTVTLNFAGITDTNTTTGQFVRLAVRATPAAGAITNREIRITHSAAATFYVGKMDLRFVGQWRETGISSLVAGSVLTFTYVEGTPLGCFHCVCPATASTGLGYVIPFPLLAGQTYRATITAKHQSGATDYILYLGEGATAATRNEAPVALTPGVWKTFSVLLTPQTTLLNPVITLRRASPNAGTFRAYGATLTGPPATLDVAIVGGLEAEGDYGDGIATNQAGWPSSADYLRDYELINDSLFVPWSNNTTTGALFNPLPGDTTGQLYMRGARSCSDGEATVNFTPGTSSDIASVILNARPLGAITDRLIANVNGGAATLDISKRVNNFVTIIGTIAVSALVVGVRYWLRLIRRGTNIRAELWNVEPTARGTPLNALEFELDSTTLGQFTLPGYFGFSAIPQTDMTVNGFACEPYDSIGRFSPDVSAPAGLSEAGAVLTRGTTLRYRSRNAAAEIELGGIDLEYSLLRAGRST